MNASHLGPDGGVPSRVVQLALATQSALTGRDAALEPYLAHARNVGALTAALREMGEPIKAAFAELGLDYQLACHALWIAEMLERHHAAHPEIARLGPSIVLTLREAERRFAREGGIARLPAMIAAATAGVPRSKLREDFLPAKRAAAQARVLRALAAGRTEEARRVFEACAPEERGRLRRLANALARLCRPPSVAPGPVGSIAEAVGAALAQRYTE